MKTFGLSTFSLLLAASLAACGGSSNAPSDAGADARDAASSGDVASDGDAAPGGGGGPFVPPPQTRQIVAGRAGLVGTGANSCTNQAGATGDRWCGFFVPSQTAGRSELWVLDATRAAAGAAVHCDGTDPSCVRLATDALHDQYASGSESGFAGDTLFYRAGTDANLIDGPVWAWRPGWATGRELVTGSSTFCYAPASRAVALCLRKNHDGAAGSDGDDLLAGTLEGADGGPLPLVETAILRSASDPVGVASDFEFGFSPDGAFLGWSTVGAASAQGLKVQKIGDASAPLAVTTGVSSWRISADGASWLWLRAYTDDGLAPSGTMETAAFPAGTGVTTLATSVGDYELVGAKGVLYRAGVADQVGDLRFMPDRAAPTTSILIDHGARSVVTRSADASTVIYTKTSTGLGIDLFAWTAALAMPCEMTSIPSAFGGAKLMAADQVVIWAQRDVISQVVSGAQTSIASCQTQAFGRDLLQSMPENDQRLLFVDGAPSGATSGTLRAAPVEAAGGVAPGTPLARDVDGVFAPLGSDAVVFTVARGTAADGLYVYAGALLEN